MRYRQEPWGGRFGAGPFHPFLGVLAAQADHPLDHAESQGASLLQGLLSKAQHLWAQLLGPGHEPGLICLLAQ